MKVLFTGASSFTGYWFVKELAQAGHEVVATFRGSPQSYSSVRKTRVNGLAEICRPVYECEFGGPGFMKLLAHKRRWDVFCHHAADVTNYRSPDFDVIAAVANNTRNLRAVLDALREKGCGRMILTGSLFEPNEGTGSDEKRAFSPYGLSKSLTAEFVRHYAAAAGIKLGKFVIPNPFGPYEEAKFTSYLARCWLEGAVAKVFSPLYVRDNIHVTLLAKAYADFAVDTGERPAFDKLGPSGYRGSIGEFAGRFAREMRKRLKLPCEYELGEQTGFPEPRARVNADVVDARRLAWDEQQAWDELAGYYRQVFGKRD